MQKFNIEKLEKHNSESPKIERINFVIGNFVNPIFAKWQEGKITYYHFEKKNYFCTYICIKTLETSLQRNLSKKLFWLVLAEALNLLIWFTSLFIITLTRRRPT